LLLLAEMEIIYYEMDDGRRERENER